MDRIALQILEDTWKHDARVMQRATDTLQLRLQEQTDGRWAAAAFEINRIYNIMEKAFERLCEAFENHFEKSGRYHDSLIERVTLDLHGIRPAFLPADAVRDIRELKGFRHLFRHAYDLDLDPARVTAAAENATRCVARFNGWAAGVGRAGGGNSRSAAHAGARGDQVVETVYWLVSRPGNASQEQDAKKRVVEGPAVVAWNADEDAALAHFLHPQLRGRQSIFVARRQHRQPRRVADQLPIALVVEGEA